MKVNFFLFLFFFNVAYSEVRKIPVDNSYLKKSLDMRDPFKRKLNRKKTANGGTVSSKINSMNGIYKNYDDNIENKPLESIKIVGVLIGPERRAMARVSGAKDSFIIKEGMHIGPNQAEVKAILPGGVILVEKIRNVYDQDEYLETVLPVSSE